MLEVQIEIFRFVDDHQPGWVECRLVDAAGTTHVFIEKVPIVSVDWLDSTSSYPRAGTIACTLIEDHGERILVDTEHPDGVESTEGTHRFTVQRSQLTGLHADPRTTLH